MDYYNEKLVLTAIFVYHLTWRLVEMNFAVEDYSGSKLLLSTVYDTRTEVQNSLQLNNEQCCLVAWLTGLHI
jgi:hypothetical protein